MSQFQQTAAFQEFFVKPRPRQVTSETNRNSMLKNTKVQSLADLQNKYISNRSYRTPVTLPSLEQKIGQTHKKSGSKFIDSSYGYDILCKYKRQLNQSKINYSTNTTNKQSSPLKSILQPSINRIKIKDIPMSETERQPPTQMNLTFGQMCNMTMRPKKAQSFLDLKELSSVSSRVLSKSQKRIVNKIFS